ncbi:MAG: GNAT family N-acetyltransferase [Nocardioidaceae bacterium]
MRLRPATAADVGALTSLEVACFARDAWSERLVVAELAGMPATRYVVLAERDGVPCGYASLMFTGDVADVHRVAVDPGQRRQGIGRRLTEALLGHAVSTGCERVLLEVAAANIAALELYRSLGFVDLARRDGYYGTGRDALVLQRSLP